MKPTLHAIGRGRRGLEAGEVRRLRTPKISSGSPPGLRGMWVCCFNRGPGISGKAARTG